MSKSKMPANIYVPKSFDEKELDKVKNVSGHGIIKRLRIAFDKAENLSKTFKANNPGIMSLVNLQFGCIMAHVMKFGISVGNKNSNVEKFSLNERFTEDKMISYENIRDSFLKVPKLELRMLFHVTKNSGNSDQNTKVTLDMLDLLAKIEYIHEYCQAYLDIRSSLSKLNDGSKYIDHFHYPRVLPEAIIEDIYRSSQYKSTKSNLLSLLGFILHAGEPTTKSDTECIFLSAIAMACKRDAMRLTNGDDGSYVTNTTQDRFEKIDIFQYINFETKKVKGEYRASAVETYDEIRKARKFFIKTLYYEIVEITKGKREGGGEEKMVEKFPKIDEYYYETALLSCCQIHTFLSTGLSSFNFEIHELMDGSVVEGLPSNALAVHSYLYFCACKFWCAMMLPTYEKAIQYLKVQMGVGVV